MSVKDNPQYVEGHGLLKGKSVLVTAAAGVGIGFSAATRAAEEGARAVMISDVHEKRLAQAVEKLKADTGLEQVYGKLCNVTDEDEVQALVNEAEEKLGGVDVLINNAARDPRIALEDVTAKAWDDLIAGNIRAYFLNG